MIDRTISIRTMQKFDVARVHEIEKESFLTPWSFESFMHEMGNPRAVAFVAERAGIVIGYVICQVVLDEAQIGTFAIDSAFRRKKIGSFLFSCLVELLVQKNVETVHLEVRRTQIVAQRCYRKWGFEVIGVRRNYYSKEKDDALLMNLSLKEGWHNELV
ncbi:MAG: ribosomal protein S18-alanine N-acetyltransferase [bacterium]